jgi:hypothetical protein
LRAASEPPPSSQAALRREDLARLAPAHYEEESEKGAERDRGEDVTEDVFEGLT